MESAITASTIARDLELTSKRTHDPSNNDETEEPETLYPTGVRLWLTLATLGIVLIMGGLDFTIIGVAVPAITQHFHSIAEVGWYSVAYRLTACAFQFAFGQLYSVLPLRWVFVAAILIFMIGSVLSAAAVSSIMFVVGRAITGIGSSGILAGVFTALMAVAPLRLRPILTSLLSGLEAVAMIASPIIGGALAQYASWRWCFWINLPVGGVALLFLIIFLPMSRASATGPLPWKTILHKLDVVGNSFLVLSLACLFMSLSWAGTKYAWSQAQIIVLLVISAACFGFFIYDQYRKKDLATLPPRILKQRSVIAGAIFSLCLNGALGVLEYYIPIYFQVVRGYSPAKAGYIMLPMTLGFNVGLLIQGSCTSLLGHYSPFMLASSIIMPIGAGLVTTWSLTSGLAVLIIFPGLLGFACGLAFEVPQIAVQTVLPEEDGAMGLSVTLFAQNFGGAIFISVAQQVFTSKLLTKLKGTVPGLDASDIQSLGLVNLPSKSIGGASHKVVVGLEHSFIQTWYIAVALACLTLPGSLAIEWRSVKNKTN